LTPNGKIDRRALKCVSNWPETGGIGTGREYQGPRNEVEEKLVMLWQDILGVKRIGIHDNFFELGGYSLKAMQMIAGFKEYPITLTDLFKYPTIAQLSQNVQPVVSQPLPFYKTVTAIFDPTHYSMKEKRLANITPFNEVLYKNCLYNAVFPVAFYFQRDILPIISNDVIWYIYETKSNEVSLETQTISVRPIMEIITESGIGVSSKPYSSDVVSDLIQAIIDEHPAVLGVDCYYEPLRSDTYQKQHWPHWILVCGFDLNEQKFEIIEHTDLNNLDYAPRFIGFSDLINVYQGYLTNFQKMVEAHSYYEFLEVTSWKPISGDERKHYQEVFLKNITANYAAIRGGLEAVPIFQKYLRAVASDEAILQKKLTELLFQIHEVAKAKSAEKYAISSLFGPESDLFQYLNVVVDNWSLLRVVLDKYRLTSLYRQATLERVIDKLSETVELEQRYLNDCLLTFEQF
jgi:aryl carrier-like protein